MTRPRTLLVISIFLGVSGAAGAIARGGGPVDPAAAVRVEIARVLDGFHEAAARGDEERYFGSFAPEGVFLGTDPGERWSVAEFRAWAKPYFERESAWIFRPRGRTIRVDPPTGAVAWFDETLESKSYGQCRGTGVLRRIDGAWKIAQYSLSVPVPNDLMRDLVRRIRGEAARARAGGGAITTVVIVRHAEKEEDPADPDPPLSARGRERAELLARMLGGVRLGAAYATEFERTRKTVEPAARAAGLEPIIVEAGETGELAERIRSRHAGEAVLVAGHSNTIPALIAALGVRERVVIAPGAYDRLFVVTLDSAGSASLLRLRFGR